MKHTIQIKSKNKGSILLSARALVTVLKYGDAAFAPGASGKLLRLVRRLAKKQGLRYTLEPVYRSATFAEAAPGLAMILPGWVKHVVIRKKLTGYRFNPLTE